MAAIGGKAVTAVGSALKSVTTNAVSAGMSFESTMSSVAALSGATGSDFDKLSDKAKQLGASTKYTSSQIASAMEYMSMAGWKADEMLSGMDGVINLTIASGGDLHSENRPKTAENSPMYWRPLLPMRTRMSI